MHLILHVERDLMLCIFFCLKYCYYFPYFLLNSSNYQFQLYYLKKCRKYTNKYTKKAIIIIKFVELITKIRYNVEKILGYYAI